MPKEIWLDPTLDEAEAAEGSLMISFAPALGTVTNLWQSGQMSVEDVEKVRSVLYRLSINAGGIKSKFTWLHRGWTSVRKNV